MTLDIEDIAVDGVVVDRLPAHGVGYRRPTRNAARVESDANQNAVPGTASVYVKTYGCSHNSSDSEYMAGQLHEYGYRVITSEHERDDADVWLVNSCTVKNPSEEHMSTDLRRGRALGKALVVAGCVSQAQPDLAALDGISIVGVQQVDRVVEVVQETLRGNTVRLLSRASRPSLDLPKVRRNPLVEIIACNTGCLGSCTYCKTVYARGRLGSYEPFVLLERLIASVAEVRASSGPVHVHAYGASEHGPVHVHAYGAWSSPLSPRSVPPARRADLGRRGHRLGRRGHRLGRRGHRASRPPRCQPLRPHDASRVPRAPAA